MKDMNLGWKGALEQSIGIGEYAHCARIIRRSPPAIAPEGFSIVQLFESLTAYSCFIHP